MKPIHERATNYGAVGATAHFDFSRFPPKGFEVIQRRARIGHGRPRYDAAVAARGRDAGSALGSDPAAAVAEIAGRVLPLVDTRDGTELVTTIAGGDLFSFGDVDGKGDAARLQHPLGVAAYAGRVFVADTYNHKIKMLDPATGALTTFAGTGVAGHVDGAAAASQFFEPGGLSAAGSTLYIADTNNHAVRTIDLTTKQVATLALPGLTPPATWSYLRSEK